jgi:hypothetical protein
MLGFGQTAKLRPASVFAATCGGLGPQTNQQVAEIDAWIVMQDQEITRPEGIRRLD